jgi:proteic killer suppression protein
VNIVFKDQLLIDLFDGKKTYHKQFRSNPSIVKKFQSTLVIIKNIEKLSQLYNYPGLHYEKLKGNLNMYSSIRLNKKYRLIFREVHSNLDFGIVDTLEIIEISNHYS